MGGARERCLRVSTWGRGGGAVLDVCAWAPRRTGIRGPLRWAGGDLLSAVAPFSDGSSAAGALPEALSPGLVVALWGCQGPWGHVVPHRTTAP